MKSFVLAIVAVLFLAAPSIAKDVVFHACTADAISVSVKLQIDEATPPEVEKGVAVAFTNVAKVLEFEDLVSPEGFVAFVEALSTPERAAVTYVYGPPSPDGGSCK